MQWPDDTIIRVPSRLNRNRVLDRGSGFRIEIRRGLISHLAALVDGDLLRPRLTGCRSRYAFEKALKKLHPKEVEL